ncbi:maestro heat-like repeat-containing protein family member 7 [Sarcoramphus papa]
MLNLQFFLQCKYQEESLKKKSKGRACKNTGSYLVSRMAERPPRRPRVAWEARAPQESSSPLKPYEVCMVQPLQTDGSWLAVCEKESVRCIQAFLKSTEKDEAQKMRFLQSIRTLCRAARHKGLSQGLDVFCPRDELAENIRALLQEEPRDHLRTAVRQQAMLAIAALSSAEAVPEGQTIPLLDACFSSVFCLPPKEDMQGLDTSLYHKTLHAMDTMLQTVVLGSPASSLSKELQSILQMLLTFTKSPSAAVRERAVGRIGTLSYLLASYSSLEAWCPFGREDDSPACHGGIHIPILGELLGRLILLSFCKDKETSRAALHALHHLFRFLQQQRCSAWPEDNLQHQRVWGAASTSCRSLPSTSATTKVFGKYLQPLERTDIILTAIEAMTDASISDKEGASSMLDEAMKDPNSWLTDVPKIMSGIHGNLEHICVAPARHSVDSLLLLLTNRCPREVVKSLLKCSPPVDSAALAMWEVMFSRLQPLEKVLRELRIELRNQRMRRLFSTVLEDTCILQLTLLAASDVRAKEFAATYNLWRSLRHQSLEMLSLVLQGLVTLSQRPETARKMRVLLEDIVETLESGNEDIQMKALLVFRNMLGHMRRQEASPIALQLAEKLLPLFNHESSQLREFSLRLFREVMQKVAWRHKRQMRKNVRQGLLPLFFHLSDQSQSVAKASGEALLAAAELLKWKQLRHLLQTQQTWRIGECLVVQDRSRAEEYCHQSLPHLKDAQATVREAAVRFIGLAARPLRDQSPEKLAEICRALKALEKDVEPSVSSLASQTVLILRQLIPQHTLAAVVFDKFSPRPGFPPKVAVFDHNLSTVAGFSLGGQRAKGKWQPPKEAGLPGELPDALPFQQPLAAQPTLTWAQGTKRHPRSAKLASLHASRCSEVATSCVLWAGTALPGTQFHVEGLKPKGGASCPATSAQ